MEEKTEKEFLEKHISCGSWEKKKEEITSIVNFPFIRNLFEKKLFNKDFCGNRGNGLKKIKKNLDLSLMQNFVKERYTNNPLKKIELFNKDDKWRNDFEKIVLGLCQINNEEEVIAEEKDVVYKGLLTRVYRLRNNYFHGVKNIDEEKKEDELFKMANRFMIICLNNQENI